MPPKTILLTEIFPPYVGGSGRLFWEIYSRQPAGRYAIATGMRAGSEASDPNFPHPIHRSPMDLGDRGLRNFRSLKYYLRTAFRIRKLMKATGSTMLHCGRNLPEGFVGYLMNRFWGVPYLFFTHGEDIGVSRLSKEMTWMTRRVIARASLAVGNSFNTKRMLIEDWNCPEDKIRVIQPGVDCSRFAPKPRCVQTRRKLGWGDRPVILTVGRLQKRKGHDRLIRTLPGLLKKYPNLLYSLVGTGEEDAALKALSVELGVSNSVQFLGGIDDDQMVQAYQQCDLFALPNRTIGGDIEGFGMVLLEAQACGKPVIAGASGGTAETLTDGTGSVVNCDEHHELEKLVSEVLSDRPKLEAMGQCGRAWVQEKFDWPKVAAGAGEVFGSIFPG